LQDGCIALQKDRVALLPVKLKKTKVKKRYFNYVVPISSNGSLETYTVLQQRKGKGIWQDLWQFPLIETETQATKKEVKEGVEELLNLNSHFSMYDYKDTIVHKLSHQQLYTKFWIVETQATLENGIKATQLEKFPVPVLIADFIKTFKF